VLVNLGVDRAGWHATGRVVAGYEVATLRKHTVRPTTRTRTRAERERERIHTQSTVSLFEALHNFLMFYRSLSLNG